jgi:hypothetical protein
MKEKKVFRKYHLVTEVGNKESFCQTDNCHGYLNAPKQHVAIDKENPCPSNHTNIFVISMLLTCKKVEASKQLR